MSGRKLYKSRTDVKIDGVCAGVAEYFGCDVTLVRLIYVVFTLFFGMGVLMYIIFAIVMPRKPLDFADADWDDGNRSQR
ncbi:MAG: PspC domain-containing protein [Clostridiales bacterium]|jgi:phage shock protein C|nr:PspC domain-containing protein [Clostridiales bacterium]